MAMDVISYTSFRSNLAKKMKEVCDNHFGLIVTRKNKETVVVISLEDYQAMEETAYLLKSPANAKELIESLKEADEGKTVKMELFEDYGN